MQEHCSIIGKLLSGINRKQFKRIVNKYDGDRYVKYFNCWAQFVCIFIGQISNLKSLREIVDMINFQPNNQYCRVQKFAPFYYLLNVLQTYVKIKFCIISHLVYLRKYHQKLFFANSG